MTVRTVGLPPGLVTRPARADDAYPICGLIAACERDLDGKAEVDADDIVADLARPALDLARDTVLVHDAAGDLVAWAQVFKGKRGEADVRPDHRGRGIGGGVRALADGPDPEVGGQPGGQP